jgi:hypothetical protein
MEHITDFHDAWYFLNDHKMFADPKYGLSYFQSIYTIDVVKVNPETKCIDDDKSKNTETNIWIESGPYSVDPETNQFQCCHDPDLDCGGVTFEEAIINLVKKVQKYYNKNGSKKKRK